MPLRGSLCALAVIVAAGACASNGLKASRDSAASPTYSMADVLAGRAPGVRMVRDTSARIILRPTNRDASGRKPLWVVDGVPLTHAEMKALELDPAQIIELYVIKPPAAVQSYGDRARDGAVLITTRRL
jgi:hypothetical protein